MTAPTLLSATDLYLFNQGSHVQLYDKLGAHLHAVDGQSGVVFGVWAPNAVQVSVIGDFNGWDKTSHLLHSIGDSGIWEGFISDVQAGDRYKYHIISGAQGYRVDKADPVGFAHEISPQTASVVCSLSYHWGDPHWMDERGRRNALDAPISVYEMHLGSWMRVPEDNNRWLTYRELAPKLADYVHHMGFTHVEFLPVMEHPFYGSWGYQTTGYFAPTRRFGTPQDFMFLIDTLHQRGIGVILDWVPSHFPQDEHGLGFFDGTHLYEHADPRQGIQPDWNSFIFNHGRNEVRSFLVSNALFWLDKYHADGLRVDAVASILYLDYSRNDGEWIPNAHGGRENLEAIAFLRQLNEAVYARFPDVQTIAEESTAWPMVSRPTYLGGLGFGMKWDMGWMHDTLDYMALDPIHRRHHHHQITFRQMYANSENFMMPLSHDEVVHGKGSLYGKMAGETEQKFAHLRLLLGYQYALSGKKLLFMGGELGQPREWDHERSLDWTLTDTAPHAGLQCWVEDLNRLYRGEPALYERDCKADGFVWVDCNDAERSVLSFLRRGHDDRGLVLVVCNFTPVTRLNYQLGVPSAGLWSERLNSDASRYGGRNQGNFGRLETHPIAQHGMPYSVTLTLPPLSIIFFTRLEEVE